MKRVHARMAIARVIFVVSALWASIAMAAPASTHRALLVADDGDADSLSRFGVALALADTAAAWASLQSAEGWDPGLRLWLRGRLLARRGDLNSAVRDMEQAAVEVSRGAMAGEPADVLRALDRDRLTLAIQAGDLAKARAVENSPAIGHGKDARWVALTANLRWQEGHAAHAGRAWNQAWARTAKSIRRSPVFAGRAPALLATGDTLAAARAWTAYTAIVSRPNERRAALAAWDAHPGLATAVSTARRWLPAARWLARNNRREEALALVREGSRKGQGPVAARCFVAVAEQLYRLRRHDELVEHLRQPWPDGLDAEDKASLEAYPWGVARREGPSVDVAHGFDTVVLRYPGTARAGEALWEAAWMWELSEDLPEARRRYDLYLKRFPRGPYAEGAALRAVYLPYWQGDSAEVLKQFQKVRPALRGGVEAAGVLWLRHRALMRLGRGLDSALADDHPHGPFTRPVSVPFVPMSLPPGEDAATVARLYQLQQKAFARVSLEVGRAGTHRDLVVASRLLQLGLKGEADRILFVHAATRGRDAAALLAVARVAWRGGHPERQARTGHQLRLLLRGQSPDLDEALDRIAFPTPYAEAVLAAAREQGLPAGLLWALMRRESFYDAEVASVANAHGLMQLLPKTGRDMAALLGEPQPSVSDLHRPLVNLRYGSLYLRGVLERAEGNLYQALASYNAGEVNGRRWRERMTDGAPAEEMILTISYTETRGYVYHILRMWNLYASIYPVLAGIDGTANP